MKSQEILVLVNSSQDFAHEILLKAQTDRKQREKYWWPWKEAEANVIIQLI